MSKRDDLLEICLARLAAGESVSACLADYPDDVDWLRPLLTAAGQLHTLPPQQPRPAIDKTIQQELRQAVQQIAVVDPVRSTRSRRSWLYFMEESVKQVSRFLIKWLPRVVVGGTAVALLIIVITQFAGPLPFVSEPDIEPAVESRPANVTIVGDTTITLQTSLTADPGEVPRYIVYAEPVPTTPAEALTWAQNFGLTDPQVYLPVNENDQSLFVIGSDGQQISFQNYGDFSEIFYSNQNAIVPGNEILPFDEAADIAIAFLENHNMLPDNYQVEPSMDDNGSLQQVIVRTTVEGGLIGGDAPGTAQRVSVNAQGKVVNARFGQFTLEPVETVAVVSAQIAYEDLLNNTNVMGSTYSVGDVDSVTYRNYQPPLPTWEIGESVDLTGFLNIWVHAETGALRIELMGSELSSYLLTGPSLDELRSQGQWGNVRVQGTISAQDDSKRWQVAVESWEPGSPLIGSCLSGTLVRSGDATQFRSEDGDLYNLPHAPEDIAEGERMEVCLSTSPEPGDELDWFHIRVPPYGEGAPSSGVVTEQVVVERVVEAPVPAADIEVAEVDHFDRPWPDEKRIRSLGHFSQEEVEGIQVLVFIDLINDQTYVITPPDMALEAHQHDPIIEREQVLLVGLVHPMNTFGGLPLLEIRGISGGTDIEQATDMSELNLEGLDEIPVIDESKMPSHDGVAGILHGEVIIDRVALVYLYEPQYAMYGNDEDEPEPQLLEPVWAFYGRSVDGRNRFIIRVCAVAGD